MSREIEMSASYIAQLISVADQAAMAAHGTKEIVYQRACNALDVSRATLMAHIKKVSLGASRKRRKDAGKVQLPYAEAFLISAYCMRGYRQNEKKITTIKEAVEVLRVNHKILGGTVDTTTGEICFLSDSAIHQGLRAYTLHPDQLRRPTPHRPLKSRGPNDVWEVDASVCVIYYLPDGETEMMELDQAVHYKNKPENLKAIEQFRVIRYVLSDHASGVIRYRYYPHAESGEHTVAFLAWAMAPKDDNDPFQGAPAKVMVDPGATAGGLVRRFCKLLDIMLIVNKAHNPRAKGQVEKANHQVETSFEQTLRYLKPRPRNFDELNEEALTYQLWWNHTKEHSRTEQTRFAVWLTISAVQLRTTPSAEVLLSLATHEPMRRQVNGDLTVHFKNRLWNVQEVPGAIVKGDVFIHWHPFIPDTAMAVVFDEQGVEQHIALPEITKGKYGYAEHGAYIGEDYQAMPDTMADTNRKAVLKLAAGTETLKAAEKKSAKKDFVPFDGQIDPLKASKAPLPTFLPRQGQALEVISPEVQLLRKNPTQMALWMRGRLGDDYRPTVLALLTWRFPEGATEPELEQVLTEMTATKPDPGQAALGVVR